MGQEEKASNFTVDPALSSGYDAWLEAAGTRIRVVVLERSAHGDSLAFELKVMQIVSAEGIYKRFSLGDTVIRRVHSNNLKNSSWGLVAA